MAKRYGKYEDLAVQNTIPDPVSINNNRQVLLRAEGLAGAEWGVWSAAAGRVKNSRAPLEFACSPAD